MNESGRLLEHDWIERVNDPSEHSSHAHFAVANMQDAYTQRITCYGEIIEEVFRVTGATNVEEFKAILQNSDMALNVCLSQGGLRARAACIVQSLAGEWTAKDEADGLGLPATVLRVEEQALRLTDLYANFLAPFMRISRPMDTTDAMRHYSDFVKSAEE